MTCLYYCHFYEPLNASMFSYYVGLLPKTSQERVLRFKDWRDAHATLYGRLLLRDGLKNYGSSLSLNDIKYSSYGKPYFESKQVGFNITHSEGFVACIISADATLIGIDAEVIRPLDMKILENLFSRDEWLQIELQGANALYHYWTCKEAVAKAVGKGLNVILSDIKIDKNKGRLNQTEFFLKSIDLVPTICLTMASSAKIESMFIHERGVNYDFT